MSKGPGTTKVRWVLLATLFLAWGTVACGEDDKPSQSTPDPTPDMVEEDTTEEDMDPDLVDEDVPDPEDMEPEPLPDPIHPPTPVQDGVDPQNAQQEGPVEAGAVRAGVVLEGSGGFGGIQATCNEGDFVLENSVARFCIEGGAPTNQLFFGGGQLIDAEPVLGDAGGRDRLDTMAIFTDLRTAGAENIDIVQDGSEGTAVVRVRGAEEPIMYIAGVVGPILFPFRPVYITTEYRLKPDSRFLEVVTYYEKQNPGPLTVTPGDGIFWGDTLTGFSLGGNLESQEGATGHGVAYLFASEETVRPLVTAGVSLPVFATSQPAAPLQSGQVWSVRRWFGVAEHIAELSREFSGALPDQNGAIEGVNGLVSVLRAGNPLANARVLISRADLEDAKPSLEGYTGADGTMPTWLEPGEYRVDIVSPEGVRASATLTAEEDATTEIVLAQESMAVFQVHERRGEDALVDSPARLTLQRVNPAEERVLFVLRGSLDVPLPPGEWNWTASRGSEFSYDSGSFVLEEGAVQNVEAEIRRVMEVPGFISGEFHQHQAASLDSEVALDTRVLSNIGEGVTFAVSSDHDAVSDFAPVIASLGAEDLITSMSGTEVSPLYGHFGAYPVEYRSDATGRGALPLAYKTEEGVVKRWENAEEIFDALRNDLGVQMIQVNHPRDNSGYFDAFDWDRMNPTSTADDGFSLDFDTLEVINGDDCQHTLDWFALLNEGHKVVGVGNSDTHSHTRPPGYPRNYIPADSQDPREISEQDIIDGVLSGDLVISAMAYLEFGPGLPSDPEAVRPGRLIPENEVTLDVRALTPDWAEVTRLLVIRNGVAVEEMEIGAGPGETVDFDGSITLQTEGEEDAWFVFIAFNPERAQKVYPGQPVFAISNPFYLDANRNGSFDAPGIIQLAMEDVPFCR